MEWCSGAFYSKKKGRVRFFLSLHLGVVTKRPRAAVIIRLGSLT